VQSASSGGVIRSNQRAARRQERKICARGARILPARTGRWSPEGARACPRQATSSPRGRRKLRREFTRIKLSDGEFVAAKKIVRKLARRSYESCHRLEPVETLVVSSCRFRYKANRQKANAPIASRKVTIRGFIIAAPECISVRSYTPSILLVSTMASTLALPRPSEKFGTHSTSVVGILVKNSGRGWNSQLSSKEETLAAQ
jgi:hypothetical protein